MKLNFTKLNTTKDKISITFNGSSYTEYNVNELKQSMYIPFTEADCPDLTKIKIKGIKSYSDIGVTLSTDNALGDYFINELTTEGYQIVSANSSYIVAEIENGYELFLYNTIDTSNYYSAVNAYENPKKIVYFGDNSEIIESINGLAGCQFIGIVKSSTPTNTRLVYAWTGTVNSGSYNDTMTLYSKSLYDISKLYNSDGDEYEMYTSYYGGNTPYTISVISGRPYIELVPMGGCGYSTSRYTFYRDTNNDLPYTDLFLDDVTLTFYKYDLTSSGCGSAEVSTIYTLTNPNNGISSSEPPFYLYNNCGNTSMQVSDSIDIEGWFNSCQYGVTLSTNFDMQYSYSSETIEYTYTNPKTINVKIYMGCGSYNCYINNPLTSYDANHTIVQKSDGSFIRLEDVEYFYNYDDFMALEGCYVFNESGELGIIKVTEQ